MLRKVSPEDALKISDQVMSALLRMFQSSTGKSGGVQEDALLAVSTLTEGGWILSGCGVVENSIAKFV